MDTRALKEQSKTFIIRQAMIMKVEEWTDEEIFLTGYCRLNQLKNYYSTHERPASQKVKLDKLKQAIKDLGGDPEEYLAKM